MAAGPVWGNRPGEKRGLYRRQCAHCHGISGDGQGPTASILNPYPRDYRPGIFKFKSTYTAAEPTEEDLRTIVHNGVPGTAMPSFALLPPDEVNALVEYVKYLSIRGQMETALVNYIADEKARRTLDPSKTPSYADLVGELKPKSLTNTATESVIGTTVDAVPPPSTSIKWPVGRQGPRIVLQRHQRQLYAMPRPDRARRRPADRLRQLEQGQS
jgi:mono/diheme cytochrome c family protein